MAWFWTFLFLCVLLMAGSLLGYLAAEPMVGREAARRNFRYLIPWLLFGFALVFIISLVEKYSGVSFFDTLAAVGNVLGAVGISAWLLGWVLRKQKAGALLADIGKTSQNKLLLLIGLLLAAYAALMTWLLFTLVSDGLPKDTSLELELPRLAFLWSMASCLIAIGLSKLEFRENGISFMYSLIKWQRINSYGWEKSKPNTLTIQFKPAFPLFPGFMSMAIPVKYKDTVTHILDERLPAKSLLR